MEGGAVRNVEAGIEVVKKSSGGKEVVEMCSGEG